MDELVLGEQGTAGSLRVDAADGTPVVTLAGAGTVAAGNGGIAVDGAAGVISLFARYDETSGKSMSVDQIRISGPDATVDLGSNDDGLLRIRAASGRPPADGLVAVNLGMVDGRCALQLINTDDDDPVTQQPPLGQAAVVTPAGIVLHYGSATPFQVDAGSATCTVYVRNGPHAIVLGGADSDIVLPNADCAEFFDVHDDVVEPGQVLVIGPGQRLALSDRAYDTRVAGVLAGAGSYRPAITLDRRSDETGRRPVSLMGKAYCWVDADHGPIDCGDLLVTSRTPGHAMAARDRARTPGAVLGKALRPLEHGRALIPMLIALQ